MRSPEERRQDRLAVALLFLLPTLLFGDVLLGAANFCMRDLARYYYPTKQIVRDIVLAGELPLWNPLFHGGQPLAANPEHEVFYPFTWLLFLPDYDLGYRLHILVHIYIALLGMYALLRTMRCGPVSAWFGAVSWGLGGTFLSYVNLLPILFCAAWLPLTCLFVRRFLTLRRARDYALAALFLGLQFLVAEPTTIAQTGLLLGCWGLYRGWREGSGLLARLRFMLRNTALIALVSVTGFAVGAVQMLPAIDHAGDSVRSRGFRFSVVETWSMPPLKFAELVYPNVLGHIGVEMPYWGGRLYPAAGQPFLFSIYPGLAVIAMAAAAFAARSRGRHFVAILFLGSALLALGSHTPLLRLLYEAGIAASVRYPEKFMLLGMFALTLFGARMLERALEGDERVRLAAASFTLASASLAALAALVSFLPEAAGLWIRFWELPAAHAMETLRTASIDWGVASARGLALFAILITMRTPRRRLWLAGAFLYLCADLGPVVHELNPRLPQRFFTERPAALEALHPDRSAYRVFHEAGWHTDLESASRYFSTGSAGFWVMRNGLFPPITAAWGIGTVLEPDYDATALVRTADLTDALWKVRYSGRPDWWRPFMAMSNAWYRGVYRPFDQELQRTGGDFTAVYPVSFQESGSRSPRYYFARQMIEIASQAEFVERLISASYHDHVAFVRGAGGKPAHGEVLSVKERANEAVIEVEATADAFLVMAVTAHKYWKVTIDGLPVTPLETNIAYQGVRVPPGRHRVVMRYRNGVVAAGGLITGIAVAALASLLMASYRRRVQFGKGSESDT